MFDFARSLSFLDNPRTDWKSIVTTFLIGKYAFETYIDYRQHQVYKRTQPPKSIQKEVTQEKFLKSQEYSRAISTFSFVKKAFSTAKELVLINFDVLPKIWSFASCITSRLSNVSIIGRLLGTSVISQSIVFFAITSAITALENMPFSYYEDFVLEENFGFNKSTVKTWISDTIKMFTVRVCMGAPFIYGFFRIVDYFGTSFVSYACVFTFIAELVLITILPNFVYPLFFKFSPLEDGPLKMKIEAVATKNGFPLTEVYVIDSSSRTSHSNAFFVGLPWSKKIVLYDTLIDQNTTEQIVAVLAHEIGHWKLNHLPQMILMHQSTAIVSMALFSGFLGNKSFFHAFGFTSVYPAYIAYYLYTYVETPISCVNTFIGNVLSRTNEFQADDYAKQQGYSHELSTALITMFTENLDSMHTDWLYSAYNHSHPTLEERLTELGYVSEEKIGNLKLEKEREEK